MVHEKYPKLFSPLRLGPVEIPNRFFFSPHGVALSTHTGAPLPDFVAYNVARVRNNGCGLVVVSMTAHDRGRHFQPTPFPASNIPAMRALADGVHEAGGKIFGELWYWWGMNGQWEPLSPPAPSMSASAAQFGFADRTMSTHEMSLAEIEAMQGAFRQSVRHLREAGFDGIMVHGSHGGVVEQFNSPYFNRRTDEYGGPLENRMRFMIEVLQGAREEAGGRMAIGMRFNCDEMMKGGYDTAGAREMLKRLCDAGLLDYVDLDVAIEPQQLHLGMPSVFVEQHVYKPYVEAVRGAAGKVPVLSVLGRLTNLAHAEGVIASGLCDMVGAARALIAEPDLISNAFARQEERSRICIACNWCLACLGDGAQGCAINPASYRERLWGTETFTPAARKSKVVVVGGGPAGLEAARVAALKGHDVTLLESRKALGGALALWSTLPGREFFHKSIDWWERELQRLGVKIELGSRATAASVLGAKPDAVVVATGAIYSRGGRSAFHDGDIPGHDKSFVYRPEDILEKGVRPKGKVLLLDGEGMHTSLGIAEVLGVAGASVEYLTPNLSPLSGRVVGALEEKSVMKRLREANVTITPATNIARIGDREVVVHDVYSERERTIKDVDAVVLCTGRISLNDLAKDLTGKVAQLYCIGDALATRPWATAAYEGQKFARMIGEPDVPNTVGEAYFAGSY